MQGKRGKASGRVRNSWRDIPPETSPTACLCRLTHSLHQHHQRLFWLQLSSPQANYFGLVMSQKRDPTNTAGPQILAQGTRKSKLSLNQHDRTKKPGPVAATKTAANREAGGGEGCGGERREGCAEGAGREPAGAAEESPRTKPAGTPSRPPAGAAPRPPAANEVRTPAPANSTITNIGRLGQLGR